MSNQADVSTLSSAIELPCGLKLNNRLVKAAMEEMLGVLPSWLPHISVHIFFMLMRHFSCRARGRRRPPTGAFQALSRMGRRKLGNDLDGYVTVIHLIVYCLESRSELVKVILTLTSDGRLFFFIATFQATSWSLLHTWAHHEMSSYLRSIPRRINNRLPRSRHGQPPPTLQEESRPLP